MSNSLAEENYLKAIYALSKKNAQSASTNDLANKLDTKASSVTDMLKKLSAKKLINYKKYQGVTLTGEGKKTAVNIIRKHRLWETFLVEKLNFKWDEVHEIAEQLEHIKSKELINRLDKFLDYPKFDPHGDPIPDKEGNVFHRKEVVLSDLKEDDFGVVIGVKDSSSSFLQYLENVKLVLGTRIKVSEQFDFDNSMAIEINGREKITVSEQVSKNLYIKQNIEE